MKLRIFCLIVVLGVIFSISSVCAAELNETQTSEDCQINDDGISTNVSLTQTDDSACEDENNETVDSRIDLVQEYSTLIAAYNYSDIINTHDIAKFTLSITKDGKSYANYEIYIPGKDYSRKIYLPYFYEYTLLTNGVYNLSIYYHGDRTHSALMQTKTIEIDNSINVLKVLFRESNLSFKFHKEQ